MSGNTHLELPGSNHAQSELPDRETAGNRHTLRAVDFFCGAGGMTHGLLAAGLDVLAGVDNHLPCKETYEHPSNNGGINGRAPQFIHADVSKLDPIELATTIDIKQADDALVFAGCSPCQFWTKLNTSRERSETSKALLNNFRRFVDAIRPGYVVIENVPGLRTKGDKSGLSAFLRFLKLAGYAYAHNTVATCLYGVPQKRWRYILIATRVAAPRMKPAIQLPTPKSCQETYPDDMKLKHHIGRQNGFPSIEAGIRCEQPTLHWAAKLSDRNLQRLKKTPHSGGSREAWREDPELQIEAYRGKDEIFKDVYGRMSWEEPASTITTRFNSLSNGRFGHPDEQRAISLREGATLQTFPLSYVFPTSFPEAARQIGNAVPPELARRIGCKLIEHYRFVYGEDKRGQV